MPRDVNQLAHRIVQMVAGEAEASPDKNPAAVALGRMGGKKGGPARAAALGPKRRAEIAKLAAQARWRKS